MLGGFSRQVVTHRCSPGFLNFPTADIRGWIILCVCVCVCVHVRVYAHTCVYVRACVCARVCACARARVAVLCTVGCLFSSIPGLYALDANSTHPP